MERVVSITLPTDNEGFALLRCSLCGERFGARPADYNAEDAGRISCPHCGMKPASLLTEDARRVAQGLAERAGFEILSDEIDGLCKELSGMGLEIHVGKHELPRMNSHLVTHDSCSEIVVCPYCGRQLKIAKELNVTGAICPFCSTEMLMEINAKEIKKVSSMFRLLAGKAVSANWQEVTVPINNLVTYVDNTPLIGEYIKKCQDGLTAEDVRKRIYDEGRVSLNGITLKDGISPSVEPWFLYQVLNAVRNDQEEIIWIGHCYRSDGRAQDFVSAFGDYIVEPFAESVNAYFRLLMIDMGIDDGSVYNISVQTGGQVNIAKDHAVINATQNQCLEPFETWRKSFESEAVKCGATSEQLGRIVDYLNGIHRELTSAKPERTKISAFTNALQTIVSPMQNSQFLIDTILKLAPILVQVLG